LQCINGFIIGDFTDSFLSGNGGNQWRWGFGIFIILIPILAAPIVITLYINMRPTRILRAELKAARDARRQAASFGVRLVRGTKSFFWQLDFIGLLLFVIGFGLFFVTITTANSRTARWSDAHSIAQLVVGAVVIAAFVIWERFWAPHPLLPFALLKRKTVLGCCLVALFHPMCGRIVAGYLYTFLIVAAGQRCVVLPFRLAVR
jgi:SIT family siderophore-iron:H+ symporter-like MFS transporter